MTEWKNEVLSKLPEAKLAAFVVWVPALGYDTRPLAERAALRLADDARVQQFWDHDAHFAFALGRVMSFPGRIDQDQAGPAWDAYLIYGPEQTWPDPASPPQPAYWMHQMMGIDAATAPFFEGEAFRAKLAQLTP